MLASLNINIARMKEIIAFISYLILLIQVVNSHIL